MYWPANYNHCNTIFFYQGNILFITLNPIWCIHHMHDTFHLYVCVCVCVLHGQFRGHTSLFSDSSGVIHSCSGTVQGSYILVHGQFRGHTFLFSDSSGVIHSRSRIVQGSYILVQGKFRGHVNLNNGYNRIRVLKHFQPTRYWTLNNLSHFPYLKATHFMASHYIPPIRMVPVKWVKGLCRTINYKIYFKLMVQ